MHWMCCCCFDQSLLLRRFSLNFPLEQLKIPKFSRLRRKKNPASCRGWGNLITLTVTIMRTPSAPPVAAPGAAAHP